MNRQDIIDIIKRYNAGNATAAECDFIEQWYSQYKDDGCEKITDEEIAADLRIMDTNLPLYQVRQIPIRLITRIAAAASVLLLIGAGIYFTATKADHQQEIIAQVSTATVPGSNKAILTLSNGEQINLGNAQNGVLARQNQAVVFYSSNGTVSYNQDDRIKHDGITYNTMATPQGGTYHLLLSDGTKVTLDASSSIRYPVAFNANERKVEVTGQAYFEVAHNVNKPFRVVSNGQIVEVLGTHFNVNAYTDENYTRTTLLQGSVKIIHSNHETIIVPGDQAKTDISHPGIVIAKVDTSISVAWKNGYFSFKRADLQTVMRQFSRWYNIEVKYENNVPHTAITGKVSRGDDASHVLNILNKLGIKFKMDGKKLIVLGNQV